MNKTAKPPFKKKSPSKDKSRLVRTQPRTRKPELGDKKVSEDTEVSQRFMIYVGNLNYRRTENGLADLFRKYGEVKKVSMVKRPGSDLKMGIAFVEMCDETQAARAIKGLNGALVDGRTLKVSQANEFGMPARKRIQFKTQGESSGVKSSKENPVKKKQRFSSSPKPPTQRMRSNFKK